MKLINRTACWLLALVLAALAVQACSPDTNPNPAPVTPVKSLRIMADYQAKSAFEDSGVNRYCRTQTGIDINFIYASSTSLRVENMDYKSGRYDAFLATSTIFLPQLPVQPEYLAKTYVVIGTEKSLGDKLRWDPKNLNAQNVLEGIRTGDVKLRSVNLSQGDPGASFFINTATVMADETMLTQNGLDRLPTETLKTYFGNLRGMTDNVDTLKAEIIKDRQSGIDEFNTYVLYESTVIQINQALKGAKPLSVYYLTPAPIAKFPIVFTGKDNTKQAYTDWVKCMHSQEAANLLQQNGYRTALVGMAMPEASKEIFNPDWGVDTSMADLPVMDYPRPDVTFNALTYYQGALKPKARAAFCFDFSGSMRDNDGLNQLRKGTGIIFDQKVAMNHGLAAGPDDLYTIFAYETNNHLVGTVSGQDPAEITKMASTIENLDINGNTAMFDCVRDAIGYLTKDTNSVFYDPGYPDYDPSNYVYTIYVMTDGISNTGWNERQFENYYARLPSQYQIKVNGVGFGQVDVNHGSFVDMVNLTHGILKDGRNNLIETLKDLFLNN